MSHQILQQFNGADLRIIQGEGGPWFVLSDLCRVLEVANTSVVASRLDEDERSKLNLGPQGEVWAVNESGLYAVILRSKKPQAREFRKWVTNEVLPTIRQTGSYATPPTPDFSALQQLADLVPQAIEARVQVAEARMEAQIEQWQAEQPINSIQKGELYRSVQALAQLMGGKPRDYRRAWASFKDHYGLAGYADLPSGKFDDALRFVRNMAAAYENPRALEFVNA